MTQVPKTSAARCSCTRQLQKCKNCVEMCGVWTWSDIHSPRRALTRTLFWILQSFIHFGTRYLPCFCANCIQLSRTISEWNSWSADSRIPCLGFMQKHAHTHVLHARQMQAPRHQSQVPRHQSQVLRHRSQVLRHQIQVLRHQSQVRHPQSQVRHPKRGIAQQLLQCIKKPYEQLTDLLFFLHAVLAELVVWSRSDAKSSCFTGFPSRSHKHVCQSSSETDTRSSGSAPFLHASGHVMEKHGTHFSGGPLGFPYKSPFSATKNRI